MARQTEFVQFVLELLALVGEVRARAMFGGFGIYHRDAMFAIVAEDRLYFRSDAVSASSFPVTGREPFTYVARGRRISLKYHEVPPEALESPEVMRDCALDAIQAALRARQAGKRGTAGRAAH